MYLRLSGYGDRSSNPCVLLHETAVWIIGTRSPMVEVHIDWQWMDCSCTRFSAAPADAFYLAIPHHHFRLQTFHLKVTIQPVSSFRPLLFEKATITLHNGDHRKMDTTDKLPHRRILLSPWAGNHWPKAPARHIILLHLEWGLSWFG